MRPVAVPAAFSAAFLAMLMCASGAHAGALYKCMENGQIHFSDKPCATKDDRQTGRMDGKPVISIGSQNGAAAATHNTTSVSSSAPLPGPIDFGKDPPDRLARGMALLHSILLDGQKCDANLKAAPDEIKTRVQCQNFLLQMRDGAQWPQTVELIKDLGRDSRFLEENIEAFKESRHLNDDINAMWKRAKLAVGDQ